MFCKHASQGAPRWILKRLNEPTALRRQAHVQFVRALHYDGRNRLSHFWTPTKQAKPSDADSDSSDHAALLIRAGFARQAHAGIFHLLPLGLRVQNKLEQLIDKHMTGLGASKVSLSSLSSEKLWARSGRLQGRDSEFLRLKDRKGAKYLLSPTHEEEITTIVAHAVSSYKDLPLRLYQVSRKYRDEARPRQGLLRGREFLMKDLYTFDVAAAEAIATYEDVRKAYCAFLNELRLPYLVANADSGNMGGSLSHEYHFVSSSGEDNVIICKDCSYAVNEEMFAAPFIAGSASASAQHHEYLITKNAQKLYKIVVPSEAGELNLHVIKRLLPDVDTSVEDAVALWKQSHETSELEDSCITIYDPRCGRESPPLDGTLVLLTQAQPNDACPSCSQPSLSITPAIEIGHTFHLSTRYSAPLGATVLNEKNQQVSLEMGCHGIGVSRLIAAVSGLLADERGLNWPLAVAPFQAVITAAPSVGADEVERAYDDMTRTTTTKLPGMDVIIDDRQRPLGWKLNDADLIGYPFIILLGRRWNDDRKVELQCRRLGFKQDVQFDELPSVLEGLSAKL